MVKDVVIVGSSFKEGMTVVTHNNTKGLVRAFDVRTGKLLWTFNTIPRPGEFGNDTWENGSWATNGNTGVWTQMTVDEELGLVYLPVESPTSDYYGGERPGNNLFGESLVCVDLKTGKRKWHFQIVHHPIWDYDLSSAPILADINVNGKAIKAVALPSKEAFLYVFDRVTGQPVWPIEERPVPQSDVPGEKTSPTQPFPTKPPAYARNFIKVPDDLIDFTPEMRAQAKDDQCRAIETGPMFTSAGGRRSQRIFSARSISAMPAAAPTGRARLRSRNAHRVRAGQSIGAVRRFRCATPPPGFSDIRYVSGRNDRQFRVSGRAGIRQRGRCSATLRQRAPAACRAAQPRQPAALNVQGLPIVKPPYGVISAINLDRGDIQWQVPYGETPDEVRNHPALKGMNIANTGQPGSVGLLVTKTLVDPRRQPVTTTPSPSARRDAAGL